MGDPVIVIDPGHGGEDPGAVGSKLKESTVVLRIANLLPQYFSGYRLVFTREDNVYIPLDRRAEIANKAHAKAFISLHCNATDDPKARGTEIYHNTGSKQGQKLAAFIWGELSRFPWCMAHGNPIKSASFVVLRKTKMPATLIEFEFISNPEGEAILADLNRLNEMARAVASGVGRFLPL